MSDWVYWHQNAVANGFAAMASILVLLAVLARRFTWAVINTMNLLVWVWITLHTPTYDELVRRDRGVLYEINGIPARCYELPDQPHRMRCIPLVDPVT